MPVTVIEPEQVVTPEQVAKMLRMVKPYCERRKQRDRVNRLLRHPRAHTFPLALEKLSNQDRRANSTTIIEPGIAVIKRSIDILDVTVETTIDLMSIYDTHPPKPVSKLVVKWTTEPIILETLKFGRFMCTYWPVTNQLEVVAETPLCPLSRNDITHPHVQDNRLCLGHSREKLRELGATGHFVMFSRVINSILNTYNSADPHLSLSRWLTVTCQRCGRNDDQTMTTVSCCDNSVCSRCTLYDENANVMYCRDCYAECNSCGCIVDYDDVMPCSCPDCDCSHCINCLRG